LRGGAGDGHSGQLDRREGRFGDTQAKQKLIPSFNDQHPDEHIHVKKANKCRPKVTVWYDTRFSTVATDTSSLYKITEAAGSMLPAFIDSPPSATSVINGIDMASDALGKVLDRKTQPGDQSGTFLVTPCGASPHYISVTLRVSGFVQISDAGDDDESVRLTLILTAGSAHTSQRWDWNGKDSDGGPSEVSAQVQVGLKEDEPFNVRWQLLEFCVTDGRVGWGATVSMIRIDEVQLVIAVVSEAEYEQIIAPSVHTHGPGGSEQQHQHAQQGAGSDAPSPGHNH
jgi:hypothetical protein